MKQLDISPYLRRVGYAETSLLVGVMGLDLSLTSTGWAYLGAGGLLSFGVIAPKHPYRLGQISRSIEGLIEVCDPDIFSIEEILRGCMRFTMLDVGMGTGAALSQVEKYQMAHVPTPSIYQSPIRLKKFVSLEPDVDKTHLQRYVLGILEECGYAAIDLPKAKRAKGDVCDAITLAISGMVAYGVFRNLISRGTVPTWFYQPDTPHKKGKPVVYNDYISQFNSYYRQGRDYGKTSQNKRT